MDEYNSKNSLLNQLFLKKETIKKVLEKYAFNGSDNIALDSSGYNFLSYILLCNRNLLADTAFQISQYSKKTRVDDRAVLFALKTIYNGELLKSIFKKSEDVSNLVRGLKKDSSKDNESVDSDRVKTTDRTESKKDTKGKKSKDTESESESESDKESVSESDKESESDSSSDSD